MNHKFSPEQKAILAKFSCDMNETGCDAIVVIGSMTNKNKTRSFVVQFGNELLCNSLIHHAFHTETLIYQEVEEDTDE